MPRQATLGTTPLHLWPVVKRLFNVGRMFMWWIWPLFHLFEYHSSLATLSLQSHLLRTRSARSRTRMQKDVDFVSHGWGNSDCVRFYMQQHQPSRHWSISCQNRNQQEKRRRRDSSQIAPSNFHFDLDSNSNLDSDDIIGSLCGWLASFARPVRGKGKGKSEFISLLLVLLLLLLLLMLLLLMLIVRLPVVWRSKMMICIQCDQSNVRIGEPHEQNTFVNALAFSSNIHTH